MSDPLPAGTSWAYGTHIHIPLRDAEPMHPLGITASIRADRDRYATDIEPRPSRFGNDYTAWAFRADNWARAIRQDRNRRHASNDASTTTFKEK